MVAVYALTMFVSAALLFVVQPMVAKMLLPTLGGSSAVWTTCMLFFQGALLAGYAYAHLGARLFSPKRQAVVHIPLMLAAFVALPIALPDAPVDATAAPTTWLLVALALSVGLPFFVVSTSAPLLQHWFANTGHRDADDPYHLYAASNFGSMVALLGYPLVIEPFLGVEMQSVSWAIVYGVLVLLTGGSAFFVFRHAAARRPDHATPREPLTILRRAKWVFWAFLPSSLMLGVTQYLTTDIASLPLLWVLPLALYLLSFILVFARRGFHLPHHFRIGLPLVVLAVMAVTGFDVPMFVVIFAHLGAFFLLALFFHGEIAKDRPHASNLTEYFLLVSVGGALGGVFNGLVAPSIFDRAIDYVLVLTVAIAAITPWSPRLQNPFRNPWLAPTLLVPVGLFYLWAIGFYNLRQHAMLAAAVSLLCATWLLMAFKPRLENVGLAIIFAAGVWSLHQTVGIVTYERSFFAAYKVYDRTYGGGKYAFRKFSHGTTEHGSQAREPERRKTPYSYQHPTGPVGQVIEAVAHDRVLVVGLGTGAMAAYATDGTHFDIYEIDPLVEEIAREYFTYLDDCGDRCSVHIGDGRNLLTRAPDGEYDIIFLDAYNSDSVPTHLLTREALELYVRKLAPHGVIVFHVSNRYLDIEGVVGALIEDAGLVSRTQLHYPPKELRVQQVNASKYTVVARREQDLGVMANESRWRATKAGPVVWTDDFTNLWGVFEWD